MHGNDYVDAPAHQLRRESRQSLVLIPRSAVLDRHVLALDIPGPPQTLPERLQIFGIGAERREAEKADSADRRLLRARRERPRRRAAERRDERAPLHSITSSAR